MKHFSCKSVLFVLGLFFSTQFSLLQAQCFDAPVGIAVDTDNGFIYWTEDGNGVVRQGNIDGSGGVTDLYDVVFPGDIAVNPNGPLDSDNRPFLFWTGFNPFPPDEDDHIFRGESDGGSPAFGVLLHNRADNFPDGIEVEPGANPANVYWAEIGNEAIVEGDIGVSVPAPTEIYNSGDGVGEPIGVAIYNGFIYWTDINTSNDEGRIMFAALDGSGTPTELFNLGVEGGPVGIAIDGGNDKIYWTDFSNDEIVEGNLDGSGSPTVLFDYDDGVFSPVHLAFGNGTLYWAELNDAEIVMGNADGSGTLTSMFVKRWDGGGNGTTWGDAANWSDDVKPTADDKVVIPINTNVTIDSGGEFAREVFLEIGSSLTIDDGATLTVDNNQCFNGVKLKEDASLTINGTLDILNVFDDGLDLTLNSQVIVGANGVLTITDSFEDGIDLEGSIFTNNGTITISNSDFAGIDIDPLDGVASAFTNNGIINIDNSLDIDDGNGIEVTGSVFQNFNTIEIDNSENDGIHLGFDDDTGILSEFVNQAGGMITIENSGDDGLELEDDDAGSGDGSAKFTNKGSISINISDDIALNVQPGTTFINNSSITMSDSGAGIDQSGGVFTNNSELSFTDMFVGVFVDEGTFTNNCTIDIEGTEVGVANIDGIFNNNGFVDIINLTTTNEALLVVNQVNNNTCGVINIQSQHPIVIEDLGTLTNDGIVTTEFTGDNEHNNGAFVNNGEVRPAAYSNTGNAITGNAPVDGAVPAADALNGSCNVNCPISVVPTLSEWGLLILALLLMTLGTVYLMQPMLDSQKKSVDW